MPAVPAHHDLRSIWLFEGCSQVELRKIRKVVEEVTVEADTLLVAEGEPGLLFFVVVSGEAAVVHGERRTATLGPGQFFGELALLDNEPRYASVVSVTDMELLVLRRRDFQRMLQTAPGLTRKLLTALAGRLRASNADVFD